MQLVSTFADVHFKDVLTPLKSIYYLGPPCLGSVCNVRKAGKDSTPPGKCIRLKKSEFSLRLLKMLLNAIRRQPKSSMQNIVLVYKQNSQAPDREAKGLLENDKHLT